MALRPRLGLVRDTWNMVRNKMKQGVEYTLLAVQSHTVGHIARPPRYESDLGSE